MSGAKLAINNSPAAKPDVVASQFESWRVSAQSAVTADLKWIAGANNTPHNRSSSNVNRLIIGHNQMTDFVNAGAEVDDIRVVRIGHVSFVSIRKEMQCSDPFAIDLDGE